MHYLSSEDQKNLTENLNAGDPEVSDEHITSQELALGYFNQVNEMYNVNSLTAEYDNIVFALNMNDVSLNFNVISC